MLKIDRTAYVGLGTRTDLTGLDQLRALLRPRGWTVIGVPVHRVLHLKSAVTALPDGTVIGFPPNVDDPDAFDEFLAVPEEHGTAVVDLGGGSILISASAPRTAELLREPRTHGDPHPADRVREAGGLRHLPFGPHALTVLRRGSSLQCKC